MSGGGDGPTVALALGAGGARGYAHIGVIDVLRERGYGIVGIAGSSMGALIGALHAAGKLDDYRDWVTTLSQMDVLRLLDVSLTAPGMIRADKLFERMHDLLSGFRIESLGMPYTAVATDLLARKAVWFQAGPLDTAVRASIAIPGVFTPLMLNGRVLVDGGMMDPVPVAPIASTRADITIAVDLGGDRPVTLDAGDTDVSHDDTAHQVAPARDSTDARPVDEWSERFRRGAANLFDRDVVRSVLGRMGNESGVPRRRRDRGAAGDGDNAVAIGTDEGVEGGDSREAWPAGLGRFDVMNQSLEAMQTLLTRYRLAGNQPDVLITVPRTACKTLDFHRANDLIALGRDLANAALDRHATRA